MTARRHREIHGIHLRIPRMLSLLHGKAATRARAHADARVHEEDCNRAIA